MAATEEKKYYTPSIEEFHVGFEFEALNSKDWFFAEDSYGWKQEIFSPSSIYHTPRTILGAIQKYWVRIKHLDQGDIESLGWEKRHSIYETDVYLYRDNKTYEILVGKKIEIREKDSYDSIFFFGHIKNKSELKKLMQQIGII